MKDNPFGCKHCIYEGACKFKRSKYGCAEFIHPLSQEVLDKQYNEILSRLNKKSMSKEWKSLYSRFKKLIEDMRKQVEKDRR